MRICKGFWAGLCIAALAGAAAAAGAPSAGPFVFTDVTQSSGLGPHLAEALNHGLAWGDFNGDGRPDLFLGNFCDRGAASRAWKTTGLVPNQLFAQTAGGKFEYVPMPSVETRGRTSGAVLADLDNDGLLDLYVNNNTHVKPSAAASRMEPSALYHNEGGRFVNISKTSGACPADGAFGRDVTALDYDGDGLLDLLVIEDRVFRPKAHSRLYRNLGGMKFEDVTARVGLPDDIDGFGVAVADVNGDAQPDFFVAGMTARLFLSRPGGRYAEAEGLRPVFDIHSRNGEEYLCCAVFGDLDNDGDLDLIVGTHFAPSRIQVYLNGGLRDGVPQFRNVTKELGIPALPNKGPCCAIEDFDNDGLPDMYWSNWFVGGAGHEPFICRGLDVRDGLPRFAVPPLEGLDMSLLRSNGVPAGRRGMVYFVDGPPVDYDGDGRLDFFGGAWGDEGSRLLHNDTPGVGNWLEVRVVGKRMNRMGIGARVRATAGGAFVGYRDISMSGGYSGTRGPVARFGLGRREAVDLLVLLPGREPLKFDNVKANQRLVVTEP
ncbi:MAG: CRTAC1 family protein [Planctomycetes bacterium]|nr:CRTAC1 family protein [Planctomycetota bacterium]